MWPDQQEALGLFDLLMQEAVAAGSPRVTADPAAAPPGALGADVLLQECSKKNTAPGRAAARSSAAAKKRAQRMMKCGTRTEYTYRPYHDGYLWRKYGQKKIKNNPFPRSYYRCSYHQERCCLATKQVQQHNCEEQPLYTVVYGGHHSCGEARDLIPENRNPFQYPDEYDAHHNPLRGNQIISFGSATACAASLADTQATVVNAAAQEIMVTALASVIGCYAAGDPVIGVLSAPPAEDVVWEYDQDELWQQLQERTTSTQFPLEV